MTEIRLWEIALLGAPAVMAAVLSFVGILLVVKNGHAVQSNTSAVERFHHTINSRMDQLLKLTEEAAHSRGMRDQRVKDMENGRKNP